MKILASHLRWLLVLLMSITSVCVHAQNLDQAGIRIGADERARLQAILDKPIDPNSLQATRIQLYRQKDLATMKLGLNKQREELLREWAQIDDEGKRNLRTLLIWSGQREEGFALGLQLIKNENNPIQSVRIRCHVSMDYLDDANYEPAKKLMAEADSLVLGFRNLPRGGAAAYFITMAEVEYHIAKSRLAIRTGKWEEGLQYAKIAVDKGNTLAKMVGQAPTENTKTWGYAMSLYASMELGMHQSSLGQMAEAEWTLRETFKASREFGFPEDMLTGFYSRVADYYNAMGLYSTAQKFAELSENVMVKAGFEPGSKVWTLARNRRSTALIGQDQWQSALDNITLIDQETRRVGSEATKVNSQAMLRGLVYLKNEQTSKALQVLQDNQQLLVDLLGPDHYTTAMNRGVLASALWKGGDKQQARQEFERAIASMTAPSSLTGDYTETAVLQKVRRIVLQSYMQLLSQTATQNAQDADLLFQLAEQLNVSKVQQALAEAAVRNGATVPGLSAIIRKEQDAKNEIATLTAYISGQSTEDDKQRTPQVVEQMRLRIREIGQERSNYKAQIQKSYPEYFQLIQPKAPTMADVAKQLLPDELFLTLVNLEDKTYVWGIRRDGPSKFIAADLPELQAKALVERVRKTLDVAALGAKAPAFDTASGYSLYKALLAPFEEELKSSRHLIVSTSGHLAQLPFATLPRQPDASSGAWLIRDVAISHVPTANGWLALKRLSSQAPAPQALLAWGDPAFDVTSPQASASNHAVRAAAMVRSVEGHRSIMDASTYIHYSKIPPLPETRDEVLELAKILNADPRQDLILGSEATRASVIKQSSSGQLAQKQVVVFATHGLLAGDLPNLNQPALAMAANKNPNESPLLTLEDVLSLKLNADWVVLSACNTAGADGKAEEALSGLARGFFYAGSRSLLVTHWSVESESAKQLTTRTFSAYKAQNNVRRAEALRQAMLAVMSTPTFSHPTYWAPYALVGEGGR
jgi:CHAT domain-containing protein